uniref:Cytochrome c oxidase-assembly factor COX23, mitochondrial n=1 Tax=Phaeosphaeria nodorum (strain SN15 / ATCC MYA-4574 / FGSC 10173) TaxID=321614 RepID=COX23_PHANO|nr:RecName: Full=Cytochrome c oxidase-assembly factor COX23, mitochondrial; Flags: Precursor [Parastagonospora nodorum SN15]
MSNKPAPKSEDKAEEWSGPAATRFDKYAATQPHKAYSEYFDPCQEAADKSIRCLKRNGGERAMCTDFFQAYRDCKEQWQNARKEARRNTSWFGK